MGIHRGPNTVNDGLVFGYDTGYGLDNFKPIRFYKGKPAANMLAHGDNFANWTKAANSGSYPTVTSDVAPGPFEGTLADRLSLPNDGSYPRIYQNYTPASTATHTFSVWLKAEKAGQGVFVGAFRNSPWSGPSSTSFTITDEWVNYSFAINPQDTTSMQLYIGSHNSHGGKEFLIYGAQLETGSSKSTFVDGTRSSTQSLIDLKKTASIDVSNVTFDSTGQPTFDGSNDQIVLNVDTLARNADTITIEGIVNATSITAGGPWGILTDHATTTAKDGFWWHYNIGGYVYFRVEDSTAGEIGIAFSGSVPFVANTYQHVVTVVGNNKVKVYVNGELSKSYTPNFQWSRIDSTTTAYLHIGRTYPNYYLPCEIPVFKMHNRELSASEIKHNHNAYKNRFDL